MKCIIWLFLLAFSPITAFAQTQTCTKEIICQNNICTVIYNCEKTK